MVNTAKLRFKRKKGDASKKPKKVIRKPSVKPWFQFSNSPWFTSVKDFLMADSFMYGPLTVQSKRAPGGRTISDIAKLKIPTPSRVFKDVKEALVPSPTGFKGLRKIFSAPVEAGEGVELSSEEEAVEEEEENHSETRGVRKVVQILEENGEAGQGVQNRSSGAGAGGGGGGGGNFVQNHSESGDGVGGHVVQSSIMTFQTKVTTTTTNAYADNDMGELRSVLTVAPPHSPVTRSMDATMDTELTEPEELEEDEDQSREGEGHVLLDFETAEKVAGALIERLGGRFSEDFGIHVDDGDNEVERWFLASNLFSRSLPFHVTKQTYKELMALGVSKTTDVLNVEEAKLAEIFERTGYSKYGQRIAHSFRKLAVHLEAENRGRVTTLKHTDEPAELTRLLRALPGVKLSSAHIFMRELRGVWRGCDPDFDNRTKKTAFHLKLLSSIKPASNPENVLMNFAQEAGIDARDLEVACSKLGAEHERDFGTCEGGPECDVLTSHDRFLSSLP